MYHITRRSKYKRVESPAPIFIKPRIKWNEIFFILIFNIAVQRFLNLGVTAQNPSKFLRTPLLVIDDNFIYLIKLPTTLSKFDYSVNRISFARLHYFWHKRDNLTIAVRQSNINFVYNTIVLPWKELKNLRVCLNLSSKN